MRVRTDERREAIVEAATEVFREKGYERASMAAIAARVGGSKATLYSYFKSKEELFVAAMIEAVEEQGQVLVEMLDPTAPDMEHVLLHFGEAYIEFMSRPAALAVTRAAVAEGDNAAVGALLYERGPKYGWEAARAYMTSLRENGLIRDVDPGIAAAHLKSLLEAGIVEPLLFGAKPEFDAKQAVAAAVDAFLRAYARKAEDKGGHGSPVRQT